MGIDLKVVDCVLSMDKLYFYEDDTGKLYDFGKRDIILIDVKKLTGKTMLPYEAFKHYHIIEGKSEGFYDELKKDIVEELYSVIPINHKGEWR